MKIQRIDLHQQLKRNKIAKRYLPLIEQCLWHRFDDSDHA